MRSSTSSSESTALAYAKALVGVCILLLVALEISSAYMVKHYSPTYARVSRQYAEAVKVRPSGPGEPASVLLVGNSLLLEGVDVDRLRKSTASRLRVYPIFLEGTGYFDWLYGLRRLFRQGARPQVVVVGLEVNTCLENAVREEYSPMMLFDARDLFRVASDLRLDRTATSSLLLSHVSAFWNTRSILRRRILRRAVPHFEHIFPYIRTERPNPQGIEFEATAMARLRNLRDLCEAHGAKLILLVPPTPSSEISVRRMVRAAEKAGVEALVPIDPMALSARFYDADEVHLNPEGAVHFTSALAADLPTAVARGTSPSPNQNPL
jgi:hypothetical protein